MIAGVHRVFVRGMNLLDEHPEVNFLTGHNVRTRNISGLDDRDESGRSCLVIEAECRLICTAHPERRLSRL